MSACGHFRQVTEHGTKLPCARPGCVNGHVPDTCQTYGRPVTRGLGMSAEPVAAYVLERWARVQTGISYA